MGITTQIAKWQAVFLLVESSNEPFQQKQHKIWAIAREATKDSICGSKYSISNLHNNVACAEIDEGVFDLIHSEEDMLRLMTVLSNSIVWD